jgi:tetratricopeptide (TPR) repeat protein
MALRIAGGRPEGPLPFNLPAPAAGWPQRPAGISLCMIVRNEARFLAAALESVRGVVDEICIVDTGSTDETPEIAARFGARVEHRTWCDDFAWARNEALAMATYRWILVLDADERLLPEAGAALRLVGTLPAALTGLWVRCRNLVDDFKGTGAMTNALVRLFPNHDRLRFRNRVHEFVTLDGGAFGIEAVPSTIAIEHHGYMRDVIVGREKAKRNIELSRRALEDGSDDPYHWYNYASSATLGCEFDVAIEALERVRDLLAGTTRGFKPSALALLADLYCEQRGDFQRAIALGQEALELTPFLANAHFTIGKSLAKLGRYFDAREAFGAAIADGEHAGEQFTVDDEISTWKAHSEIGTTLACEGRHEESLAWFELGLTNRPEAQPLRLNRARALEALGRFAEARAAFRWAYDHYRDDLSGVDYVNYLLRRGTAPEALDAIDAASARVSPTAAVMMLGTAVCIALRAGHESTARDYLERARAAVEAAEIPGLTLAELFVQLGEYRAVTLLEGPGTAPAGGGALPLAQGILGGLAQRMA